jgi:hypothetical protein
MTDEITSSTPERSPGNIIAQIGIKMFGSTHGIIVMASELEGGATTAFDFASNLMPSAELVALMRATADRIEQDLPKINEAIRGKSN